jgi:glycosyltransferase involved in cell wall biosynthesis
MNILLTDTINEGHHLEYASLLSAGLKSLGHQVFFFGSSELVNKLKSASLIQDGIPFDESTWGGVYFQTEDARVRYCRSALKYSLKIQADLCHFLYIDHFIISAACSRILQNKSLSVCATLHAPYFLPDFAPTRVHKLKGMVDLTALRFLASCGLRVMVHSEICAAYFNNKFMKTQRFDYVPYPIKSHNLTVAEKTDLRTRFRTKLGLASQNFLLLVFGSTRYDKGADMAIKMLSYLPQQYHLLFAGENTYFSQAYLTGLAAQYGFLGRVHFDNRFIPEDEMPAYFFGCDIVLIPYRKNFAGQSGPLTIAGAFGIKVVAPNLPVLAETVLKNQLGYLYPVENVELMADTIQKAIDAPVSKYSATFIHEHSPSAFTEAVFTSYSKSIFQHEPS